MWQQVGDGRWKAGGGDSRQYLLAVGGRMIELVIQPRLLAPTVHLYEAPHPDWREELAVGSPLDNHLSTDTFLAPEMANATDEDVWSRLQNLLAGMAS